MTIMHHDHAIVNLTPVDACECDRCTGFDAIDAHPSEWPAWTDEYVWTVTEEIDADWEDYGHEQAEHEARQHLQGDRLSLRALVARQCDFYASWDNEAGAMIADHLAELVRLLEVTDASTPAEHYARIDCLDHHYS